MHSEGGLLGEESGRGGVGFCGFGEGVLKVLSVTPVQVGIHLSGNQLGEKNHAEPKINLVIV